MEVISDILNALVKLIPRIAGAILLLTLGFPLVKFLSARIRRNILRRRPNLDVDVLTFIDRSASFFLTLLVVITAIAILGVETTSLAAAIGTIGFAVGLALQGALGNLAAGILILMFKPYHSGDWITTQGYSGTVQSIQLFSTIINTFDNHRVIIPNGSIVNGPIENFSIEPLRQHNITVRISHRDNIQTAREVIRQVVDQCPGLRSEPEPKIFVADLADSSINLSVRFWTTNEDFWPAIFYFQEHTKTAFDQAGISIPFPQMEVTMPEPSKANS